MNNEKIILEINQRTKEKKKIDLLDYQISENYTVRDLIVEHQRALGEIEKLNKIVIKLADSLVNINKSLQVQIIDIKEEVK